MWIILGFTLLVAILTFIKHVNDIYRVRKLKPGDFCYIYIDNPTPHFLSYSDQIKTRVKIIKVFDSFVIVRNSGVSDKKVSKKDLYF